MANKIIHKHSSVITDGKPKIPTSEQLEYGEMAVNYADGVETISMKNSANKIVEFKSNDYYLKIIKNNEYVTAASLTDLDNRINTIGKEIQYVDKKLSLKSDIGHSHDDIYYTETEIDTKLSGKSDTGHTHYSSAITDSISASSGITSGATGLVQGKAVHEFTNSKFDEVSTSLSDLDERITTIEDDEFVVASAITDLDNRLSTIEDNNEGVNFDSFATKTEIDAKLAGKSDTGHTHVSSVITDSISASSAITSAATGLVQGKAVHGFVKSEISNLVNGAPETLDTLGELSDALRDNKDIVEVLENAIANKADNLEIDEIRTIIDDNEYVTAASLSDLDGRINTIEEEIQNVDEKLSEKANVSHSHVASEVTGGTFDIARIPTGTTSTTVSRGDHNHDDRYYTETEIDTKLSLKSDTGHTHVSSAITDSISDSTSITSGATELVQGKAVHGFVKTEISNLVNGAPETLDTLGELSDALRDNKDIVEVLENAIANKANNSDIDEIRTIIDDNEYVTAASLSDLDGRINAIEEEIKNGDSFATNEYVDEKLSEKANVSHSHVASEVTGGTFDIDRIPTGTTSTTVSRGDHNHDDVYYTETEVNNKLAGKSDTGHTHVSSVITDSISASTSITSAATGLVQGKAVHGFVKTEISNLVNGAPETLDTLGELSDALRDNKDIVEVLENAISNKADNSDIDEIRTIIDDNEYVTAASLSDLDGRITIIEEEIQNIDSFATKTEIDTKLAGKSDTGHTHVSSVITDSISDSTSITSGATELVQGKAVHGFVKSEISNLVNGAPETLDTLGELSDALRDNKDIVEVLENAIANKQETLISSQNIKTINGNSILGSGDMLINIEPDVQSRGIINLVQETAISLGLIMSKLKENQLALYIVGDSNGNLPSNEKMITVENIGVPILFGKTDSFGVSVGDLLVVTNLICKIIPINDAKPSTSEYNNIGADGICTVWDKNQINKIPYIESTLNNKINKDDVLPSLWSDNMDNALNTGIYPWCTLGRPEGSTGAYTCVTEKTSTADGGGYNTIIQTAYGREGELGQIYKRIIFKNDSNGDTQYGEWKKITIEEEYVTKEYIENNEFAIASAMSNLDERIKTIEDNEVVVSSSITDLDNRLNTIESEIEENNSIIANSISDLYDKVSGFSEENYIEITNVNDIFYAENNKVYYTKLDNGNNFNFQNRLNLGESTTLIIECVNIGSISFDYRCIWANDNPPIFENDKIYEINFMKTYSKKNGLIGHAILCTWASYPYKYIN